MQARGLQSPSPQVLSTWLRESCCPAVTLSWHHLDRLNLEKVLPLAPKSLKKLPTSRSRSPVTVPCLGSAAIVRSLWNEEVPDPLALPD